MQIVYCPKFLTCYPCSTRGPIRSLLLLLSLFASRAGRTDGRERRAEMVEPREGIANILDHGIVNSLSCAACNAHGASVPYKALNDHYVRFICK